MSGSIKGTSGERRDQINNWREAALKWQSLFTGLCLRVEMERYELQVNEISWVKVFTSNTVNNCCSVMHILVLLRANFLNINNNNKDQTPLQLTASAELAGSTGRRALVSSLRCGRGFIRKDHPANITLCALRFLLRFPFSSKGCMWLWVLYWWLMCKTDLCRATSNYGGMVFILK